MASEKHSGLRVAGAGLPRSSTLSLKTALEKLGFTPTYHVMTHVIPNPQHQGPAWTAICRELDKTRRQELLRAMYDGRYGYAPCVAAVDGPTCFFADDFVEMYPGIKIVLGVRDSPEAWYKSFMNSVGLAFEKPLMYWMTWWVGNFTAMFHFNDGWNELCLRRYGVDARSTDMYRRHVAWVQEVVPADQLLVHNAKDGWAPLCAFLDVPVPEGDYPRVNDTESLQKLIQGYVMKGLLRWALVVGGAAAAGAAYWQMA